jgi:hypothetical protein
MSENVETTFLNISSHDYVPESDINTGQNRYKRIKFTLEKSLFPVLLCN